MTDLVRRLRRWAERWPAEVNTANLVIEAAGHIAQLEAMIRELCDNYWLIDQDDEIPDRAIALLEATTKKD